MTKPQTSSKIRSFYLIIVLFLLGVIWNLDLSLAMGNAAMNGEGASIGFYAREFPVIPARCPLILAPGESTTISVTIPTNTSDVILLYNPSANVYRLRPELHVLQSFKEKETLLPPGETLDLTWNIRGTDENGEYILIQMKIPTSTAIHNQLGNPDQSIYNREQPFSFNAVCGIAIRSILGLNGRPTLFLSLAIHLLGSALFFLYVFNRLPMSLTLKLSVIILALLTALGPAAALFPISQKMFAYVGVFLMYVVTLLLLILVIHWLVIRIRNSRFLKKKKPPLA